MKRKNSVVKKAVVDEKDVLVALSGVIEQFELMSRRIEESKLVYLRIAVDNAISVARQYYKDFEVFFESKGG